MIKFTAAFGDQDKQVKIVNHFGGGGSYYIYVDMRFYGTIHFQQGEWCVYLNDSANEELTTEDRIILVELVTNNQRQNPS